MSRIIDEGNMFEIVSNPNFFKDIAISIWERDMTYDGINFRKKTDKASGIR